MFAGNLIKAEKKEIFFEPCLSCFLLSLSSPFAAKIVRFLKLIRSLHNVKYIPFLSGLQGWINPSEFALKKIDSAAVVIFVPTLASIMTRFCAISDHPNYILSLMTC